MKYSICFKKEVITEMYIESLKKRLARDGFVYDEENPEYVFFLGGDGTFLRAVHKYIDKIDKVKFVGLNAGTLGFFLDYTTSEINLLINDLRTDNVNVVSYPLLKGKISSFDKNKIIYAVNEIRLENNYKTLVCDVSIEDHKLETFSGNGLIVSSSLGSSAYNRSLGGALIEHDLPLLEISEIASIQNNAYRSLASSLVVSGKKHIKFSGLLENVIVGYDHEIIADLKRIKELTITLSDKRVKLVRKIDHNYIDVLRKAFISDKEVL